MRALLRRKDRPVHRGETIDKESGIVLHDVVLRFEPGDKPFRAPRRNLAEADEGPHLMDVVPDGFLPIEGLAHGGIDHDLEELRFTMRDSPEQAIKQRPPSVVSMKSNEARQFEEFLRHTKFGTSSGARGNLSFLEKIEHWLVPPQLFPRDGIGRDLAMKRGARHPLPRIKIPREADPFHSQS